MHRRFTQLDSLILVKLVVVAAAAAAELPSSSNERLFGRFGLQLLICKQLFHFILFIQHSARLGSGVDIGKPRQANARIWLRRIRIRNRMRILRMGRLVGKQEVGWSTGWLKSLNGQSSFKLKLNDFSLTNQDSKICFLLLLNWKMLN